MSYCIKITILAEIMHKNALFLLKNYKHRPALRAKSSDPFTSGG